VRRWTSCAPLTSASPTCPGWPYEPSYARDLRRLADGVRRRGLRPDRCCCCTASRRGATSTAGWCPVLVEAGLPVRRARPHRVRPVRQAHPPSRTSPTRGTSSWLRSVVFDALDLPTSRSSARTGAGCSACASSRSTLSASRGLRRQHRLPDGTRSCPTCGGSSATSSRRPPTCRSASSSPAAARAAAARGRRGVRRAVPRRVVQGRAARLPRPHPAGPGQPGDAGHQGGRGGCSRRSTSRSSSRSATRNPIHEGASGRSRRASPAPRASRTPSRGRRHFLQEDRARTRPGRRRWMCAGQRSPWRAAGRRESGVRRTTRRRAPTVRLMTRSGRQRRSPVLVVWPRWRCS
jgi:hypothetical protein